MSDKSIWAVTSGEYSDYGIVAVFSTQEIAEQFAAKMNSVASYEDYRVEEFDFYDALPPMHVVWTAEQSVERDSNWQKDPPEMMTRSRVVVGEAPEFDVQTISGRKGSYSTRVMATGTDKERCIKAVSDRIARLRAEREGIA